jgi:tetratricopeptide (TPR) repeat protein
VEARNDYSAAEEQLAALAASRPQRLTEALQAGWQHLETDDGPAAAEQFTLALILEPGLEEAEHGLARAEVRPAVLERMTAGRLAETSGQPEAARQAFLEAAGLDVEFTPAVEAAARIAAEQADSAFGSAMSRALAALDTGRYAAAAKALDEAARLRPGDQVVTDARRRLVAARRAAELARLRREGDSKVAQESWTEAEALYRAALKIDPAAGFASHGLERASGRARLHARIDHYLAAPPRLYSPEPLAEAERLLADSTPIPAGEPQLAAKTRQLATLVDAAKQPRSVRLRSDGETEVTVYHVGRLGRFAEQTLQLRPGSYTVVGARPGYRDVRITFTVAPGQPSPAVDVRCRELL